MPALPYPLNADLTTIPLNADLTTIPYPLNADLTTIPLPPDHGNASAHHGTCKLNRQGNVGMDCLQYFLIDDGGFDEVGPALYGKQLYRAITI